MSALECAKRNDEDVNRVGEGGSNPGHESPVTVHIAIDATEDGEASSTSEEDCNSSYTDDDDDGDGNDDDDEDFGLRTSDFGDFGTSSDVSESEVVSANVNAGEAKNVADDLFSTACDAQRPLPPELWRMVFSYLCDYQLCASVMPVCRQFHNIALSLVFRRLTDTDDSGCAKSDHQKHIKLNDSELNIIFSRFEILINPLLLKLNCLI